MEKISDPIKGRMIPKTFSVTDWVWRSLVARQNGVLEVASSILVTQTISSVHNRFQLWTLDIFCLCLLFG